MSLRTTPLIPRSRQPFAALDAVLLKMIAAHVGRPCPTSRDVRDWTGMPWRQIWPYLDGMAERGLIEMETQETKPCGKEPKRRRMRAVGGQWTLWTQRGPVMAEAAE